MPRKECHEAEEKVNIVRRILKCEMSICAARLHQTGQEPPVCC